MPSFFKELRRISRSSRDSSSRPNHADASSSGDAPENGPSGSSSSVDSTGGSQTPPTSLPSDRSARSTTDLSKIGGAGGGPVVNNNNGSNKPPLPNRYSIASTLSLNTFGMAGKPQANTSPLAPRVLSVSDNSWVHQRILLIYGQVGDPLSKPLDGFLTVYHHLDTFPPTGWPVCDSHFKALVHLQPGPNKLRIDFVASRSSNSHQQSVHTSWISINYLPLNSAPPLHLAILVARDSPCTFDAVPQRVQTEGNGLDTAIRKFRMAAYLWQAFTGEQMSRAGFGRRCFRYEEEWTEGTLSVQDRQSGRLRNEAKIHVIRMDQTLKELRDLDVAQQYGPAKRKGDLYGWAGDAVKKHFKPRPGQKLYVSCLLLDSHWDPKHNTVTAHAALGGANDPVHLAIFGSHALQSYPAAIEEVVPAFTDCTRTDTKHVANDCNESGSSWEACNIGIGAHLHETGHALGCPHQQNGVMLRDYVRLNRTFTCREPYSTRTKSPGQRLTLQNDECTWHRLDCLRFRFHPAFRLPTDAVAADDSIQVWAVDNGTVLATAPSGIAFVEIFGDGDDVCRAWLEFATGEPALPKQLPLIESELRARLPADKQKRKLRLELHSAGQGRRQIDDLAALTGKAATVKLTPGLNPKLGFRSAKLGFSQQRPSEALEVVLQSAVQQTKLLTAVRVFHGSCLDGLEFLYEDRTSQLFGRRGGTPGGSLFELDTRRGETIVGFYVRAGLWIDGLQILTSVGRRSEVYGNATGGSGHTLIPPRGYSIAGIYGTCGQWIDGFGVIITR